MTEKRFIVDDSGYVVIDDNSEKAFMFDTIEDCYACCDLLNEQHEENEQLKQSYNDAKLDVERYEQILKDIMNDNLLIQDLKNELKGDDLND